MVFGVQGGREFFTMLLAHLAQHPAFKEGHAAKGTKRTRYGHTHGGGLRH